MLSTLTVRLATTSDAPAISSLILRTLHEVNVRDYGPALIAEQAKNWTVGNVVAKMENRDTYVAIHANDIVGTAAFDGERVRAVFVDPNRHQVGVGTLLMQTVEALAVERGVKKLSLQSSITAQGFYERLGYISVRDGYHGAERTILMEKQLTSAESQAFRYQAREN